MKKQTVLLNIIPFLYFVVGAVLVIVSYLTFREAHFSVDKLLLLQTVQGAVFIFVTGTCLAYGLKNIRMTKQLKEEKEKLALLIDNIPDMVTFKDGEGRCLQINQSGAEMIGLGGVDCIGKSHQELAAHTDFYHDAIMACIDIDEQAWQKRKISRVEELLLMEDGSFKTIDTVRVPLFNPDGSRKALLVIGRDISELKKTEKMLRQSEKLSVLGELAAGIAHEIRNPLTTVKGFMQLGQDGTIRLEDHLSLLISELDRMNNIVTELLLVAKPQDAPLAYQNVNKLAREVVNLLSTEASLQNTQLHFAESDQFHMNCYDTQLKQVFINILKNALDSISGPGKITVSINEKNDQFFSIQFQDNGCGIEESRLARIGEPFYSAKEKGIGLGMTVSSRIIKSHKGSIHITSKIGAGTNVEVILPKAPIAVKL